MWKADIWIVLLESFSDKQKQQTNKKVIAQRRKNYKFVAVNVLMIEELRKLVYYSFGLPIS